MNTLERIRTDRDLTYEALGRSAGYGRHVAWKHCRAEIVPAEAAIRYSRALGVSLKELRPDLFEAQGEPTPTPKTATAE